MKGILVAMAILGLCVGCSGDDPAPVDASPDVVIEDAGGDGAVDGVAPEEAGGDDTAVPVDDGASDGDDPSDSATDVETSD